MIGLPSNACVYQTCDSTNTRLYSDTFVILQESGKTTKDSKSIQLCKVHVQHIVQQRQLGRELCMTREGWVYIDNFRWLLFGSS